MRMLVFLLILSLPSFGQDEDQVRILEDQADQDDVKEVEEDLIQLRVFVTRPLNINTATAEELHVFPFLTHLHVQQLVLYRKYAGELVDAKELQAVPGWDVSIVRKLMPYVTVRNIPGLKETFGESLKKGRHQFLTRFSLNRNAAFLVRYHFNSPALEWGVNLEKDAGERLLQGPKGISFLSGHALLRNRGAMKLWVIGDYVVNLGQGLTLWQGRAVRKTAMPIMIKKQMPLLMPYRSNDENRYFRGTAAWFVKGKSEAALFVSSNGLDANTKLDSSSSTKYVTSFLNTGYHRDPNELEDKNAVHLFSAGGMLGLGLKRVRVTASSVVHRFSLPVVRESLPYNFYASGGRAMANHALNVHRTWRNVHFFGELAMDREGDLAAMAGFMMGADPKLDISLAARKIGKGYRSFFASAFTEASEPSNEEGIYTGITYRFGPKLVVDAYADHYRFPWLRYRVDAPGSGRDYLAQLSFTPQKKTSFYVRYRSERKSQTTRLGSNIKTIGNIEKQVVRLHLQHKVNAAWEWRMRLELNELVAKGEEDQHGFLLFTELFWKPSGKPFSISGRALICETKGYESRIYAYENDVMFYNIVPAFYGKTSRLYLNTSLQISDNIEVFVKIARNFQENGRIWATRCQFIWTLKNN